MCEIDTCWWTTAHSLPLHLTWFWTHSLGVLSVADDASVCWQPLHLMTVALQLYVHILTYLLTCRWLHLYVGFIQRPDDFKHTLFVARITDWNENMAMPKGSVLCECHQHAWYITHMLDNVKTWKVYIFWPSSLLSILIFWTRLPAGVRKSAVISE